MNSHPSDSQLHDFLDGELRGHDISVLKTHIEDCARCQARLDSTRALLSELKLLSKDAKMVPARWNQTPLRYLHPAVSFRYPALNIAAAVFIFAIGITLGTRIGRPSSTETSHPSNPERGALAEQIQQSGTQYIAAIATWRRKDGLTADAGQGFEVALATLYGAAYELQKLQPKNPKMGIMFRSIENLRNRDVAQGKPEQPENRP